MNQKLMIRSLLILWPLIVASGCAHNRGVGAAYQPIVDMKGVNQAQYQQDLSECQSYAQQSATVGEGAAGGAVAGAVVGGVIGAIVGDSSTAAKGAGVGGVTGGVKGGVKADQDQKTVIKNCLRGRGYNVLN